MTPLFTALKLLLKNPRKNWKKVIPYILSYTEPLKRKTAEYLGLEIYSKPYQGHEELLNEITKLNGFFVQCGGSDGYSSDPTYYLERFRNWTGIIAEPIPKVVKLCKFNRPHSRIYQTALVSNEYSSSEIELSNCHSMSVTPETRYNIEDWTKKGELAQNITTTKIKVPAMTLDAMIKDSGITKDIDLLVLDTEGSEIAILNGFSISRYLPQYILVEIVDEKLLRKEIEDIFSTNYTFIKKLGYGDYLYKRA